MMKKNLNFNLKRQSIDVPDIPNSTGEEEPTSVFSNKKPKLEESKLKSPVSIVDLPPTNEPYPYFYHTWNKLLLCNLNDVSKTFNTDIKNTENANMYVYNKELNEFKIEHDIYGNSLQNYYIINQQLPLSEVKDTTEPGEYLRFKVNEFF